MSGANFEQAFNAGIRIDVGGSEDAYVGGLNTLKPYGITNQVNDVNEFRIGITSKYTSVGDLGGISYGGNDLSDDGPQSYLKAAALAKTKLTNIRFYKNLTDFFMPDLGSDPESSVQVSRHEVNEADVNGVYEFSGEMVFNGAPATFYIHHTSSTMVITPNAGGDTIVDSTSGDFVNDGIKIGDTILLEGVTESTDDYTQHVVKTVTADTITLESAQVLTAQLTGSEFTLHAGRF